MLTVVPPVSTLYGWLGREKEAVQAAQAADHQRAFDDFLQPFDFHGVAWRKLVRHGPPDLEILAAAADIQSDLIVMGSVGRTGTVATSCSEVSRNACFRRCPVRYCL